MGESNSTKMIVITVLYFFAVMLLMVSIDGAVRYMGQSSDNYTYNNASFESLIESEKLDSFGCDRPRYSYRITSDGLLILNDGMQGDEHSIGRLENSCDQTKGIADANTCNSIEGCSWGNETDCLFFNWLCGETYQTCLGDINRSYYFQEEVSTLSLVDICSAPLLNNGSDEAYETCNYLGCSIESYNSQFQISSISLVKSLAKSLWSLMTFRLSFETQNWFLSIFCSFVGFYLPILLLILQIRYLFPF